MSTVRVGASPLEECARCGGIWVDKISFEQICSDRDKQAAVLGAASALADPGEVNLEQKIRYVPCPLCRTLMHRVNFAHCSHVVVDVCKDHGTWFDKDELRQIVEFIRAGGLEAARAKEIAELEKRERQLKAERIADAWSERNEDWGSGIAGASSLLKLFRY